MDALGAGDVDVTPGREAQERRRGIDVGAVLVVLEAEAEAVVAALRGAMLPAMETLESFPLLPFAEP